MTELMLQTTKFSWTITYCLLSLLLLLIINGCGTVDQVHKTDEPSSAQIIKAEKYVKRGNYDKASELYWQAAKESESPLREEYQLRAAELQIEGGNFPLAYQYLGLTNEQNLTFELIPRKRIAEAKIAIHEERFNDALAQLPDDLLVRAPEYKSKFLLLRAIALAGIGDTLASLQARVDLSDSITDPVDAAHNQNEIWRLPCFCTRRSVTSMDIR